MPQGARAWLARLALVAGGLLVGLVLAEGIARLVAPEAHADLLFNAPDTAPEGLYLVDHDLMMVPAPGFAATARGLGHTVDLRINAHGLRGPEVGAKTVPRWLAVGDSFTMSVQVDEAQTFVAGLAERTGTEVLNAGVDGDSTWQATGRYEALDGPLAVDGVLLTFFLGNDLQDNERFPAVLPSARQRAEGQPIPRPASSPVASFFARRSYLVAHYRVWSRARSLASGADPARQRWADELRIFTRSGGGELQRFLQPTRRALEALVDSTRQREDRLVVALAPPAFVVDRSRVAPTFEVMGLDPADADLDAPARAVAHELERLGLSPCDLTGPLRAGQATAPMYLTYDGHWTPEGHAVVAEALAACMDESP